jgi:hypothetical protein
VFCVITTIAVFFKEQKEKQFSQNPIFSHQKRTKVTNDGVTFKLQCDSSGQFLRRDWPLCR